jgi:excisionase family DNA binding protein
VTKDDDRMPKSAVLREALEKAKKAGPAPAGMLSVPEACRYLGIGRTTLYAQMSRGKLAYVKIGKRRLISLKAIERFIEQLEGDQLK